MTTTKPTRSGDVFNVDDTVKVFGKHVAKIVSVHSNGSKVKVTGDTYDGFVGLDKLKAVPA